MILPKCCVCILALWKSVLVPYPGVNAQMIGNMNRWEKKTLYISANWMRDWKLFLAKAFQTRIRFVEIYKVFFLSDSNKVCKLFCFIINSLEPLVHTELFFVSWWRILVSEFIQIVYVKHLIRTVVKLKIVMFARIVPTVRIEITLATKVPFYYHCRGLVDTSQRSLAR